MTIFYTQKVRNNFIIASEPSLHLAFLNSLCKPFCNIFHFQFPLQILKQTSMKKITEISRSPEPKEHSK